MSKSKVVPLRIPEHLDELASFTAQVEHTDKATALRQWLHEGAGLYVLKLVAEGRISIGRAAELLDISIYDIHGMAERYAIELGPTKEQMEQSHEVAMRLAGSLARAGDLPKV